MSPVMFIAGEASGDSHAAAVIRALDGRVPVFGVGGPKMCAAGMELLFDLAEHAVVGFIEVLKNYGKFKRFFDQLLDEVGKRKPSAVVLVDFPGFNLRFAKAVKRRYPATKVIYYISPQLWAWHASRAKQIERDVDLLLTIFPFEKAWYATRAPKLRVEFVGHPFADGDESPKLEARNPKLILLLPGSREREVSKLWPVMSKVVDRMPGDVKFVAAAVSEQTSRMMQHPLVEVQIGAARELMQRATLAITASGTATMECAFAGCPMIVVYKVNWLTYLIGRALVKVKWLAMPNIIANYTCVGEFIQHRARPSLIAAAASDLLEQPEERQKSQQALADVIKKLGGPGASARAAQLILEEVK